MILEKVPEPRANAIKKKKIFPLLIQGSSVRMNYRGSSSCRTYNRPQNLSVLQPPRIKSIAEDYKHWAVPCQRMGALWGWSRLVTPGAIARSFFFFFFKLSISLGWKNKDLNNKCLQKPFRFQRPKVQLETQFKTWERKFNSHNEKAMVFLPFRSKLQGSITICVHFWL